MDTRIKKEEIRNFNIGDSIWTISSGYEIDEVVKVSEFVIVGKLIETCVTYFIKAEQNLNYSVIHSTEIMDLHLQERWYKSKVDALNSLLDHTLNIRAKVDSKISSILNMINCEKTTTTTIVVDAKNFIPADNKDKLYR
jgi:hypothetical protein